MGMLLVLSVVIAIIMLIALFTHALRTDPSPEAHKWLLVVPLLIIVAWVLQELIMG